MPSGKEIKCWGVSYGLIGDLIMGLPVLTYLEKKYPGSYKYWVIEKKVAFTAPLFLNHPLIDCIRITGEWSGFGREDFNIASQCEFSCIMTGWKHDEWDWYNRRGQVEETARIAGIYDLKDVLTPEEMYPKLNKWFDVGEEDPDFQTYSRQNHVTLRPNSIAIWPFATSAKNTPGRNPSMKWWENLVLKINNMDVSVIQLGYKKDETIPGAYPCTDKTFFEQVKIALACKMSIGTDSGNMWVMGAYGHPAIHLMTNWLPGHTLNPMALEPVNENGETHFAPFVEGGVDIISPQSIIQEIKRMMKA